MAEATVKNDFSKGPMWQVIVKMAVPMMMAQLVNVLNSAYIHNCETVHIRLVKTISQLWI